MGMNRSTNKTVENLSSDITANTDLVKVVVSSDGNVIVASGAAGTTRLYVSTNGGTSFFNCIGNGTVAYVQLQMVVIERNVLFLMKRILRDTITFIWLKSLEGK